MGGAHARQLAASPCPASNVPSVAFHDAGSDEDRNGITNFDAAVDTIHAPSVRAEDPSDTTCGCFYLPNTLDCLTTQPATVQLAHHHARPPANVCTADADPVIPTCRARTSPLARSTSLTTIAIQFEPNLRSPPTSPTKTKPLRNPCFMCLSDAPHSATGQKWLALGRKRMKPWKKISMLNRPPPANCLTPRWTEPSHLCAADVPLPTSRARRSSPSHTAAEDHRISITTLVGKQCLNAARLPHQVLLLGLAAPF